MDEQNIRLVTNFKDAIPLCENLDVKQIHTSKYTVCDINVLKYHDS
jgi:hypothetical protein